MKRTITIIAIVIGLGGFAFLTRESWRGAMPASVQNGGQTGLAFAVIGDTEGHADLFKAALAEAKSLGAEFVIHTGDISEDGSPENMARMAEVVAQSGIEVMTAVGNHDIRDDPTRQLFIERFNQPNLAFDRDQYRFLLLDNADRKVGFSDATLEFARRDFETHPNDRYVLVFHRPFDLPLAALVGDDETPASRMTNDIFLSLISQADISVVFNGHLHLYLPFTFHGIRAFVTGGGGGEAQSVLGPLGNQEKHFLMVRESGGQFRVEVVPLE